MVSTIKQLEEKNISTEINLMAWSNRMDIVGLANAKGEVTLHRLTWKTVWVLNPPKDGVLVNYMSWRPDGNVLAISYDNNTVILVNIETKATITNFEVCETLSYLGWAQEEESCDIKPNEDLYESINEDLSQIYLNEPSPISNSERSVNVADAKGLPSSLQSQADFNLLILGTKEGTLEIRVLGCAVKLLSLNMADYVGYKCSIENVHLSKDLTKMFISICNQDVNRITTILFNSAIFKTHCRELYQITMKYIKLYELLSYFNQIIMNITETWENILIEIDDKLSKYANQVPEGGLTADFLELLTFGYYTNTMESFLMHDLTRRGLEKFGQTMEISYSSIQSYLFQHIIKYAQNGIYYLSELKGMADFEERYSVMGLNIDHIQKAIHSNGAFVMKAVEMQQIINHSVTNFKAFFRWLYSSIVHINEEIMPEEIQKVTQQDVVSITEFLRNFDKYGTNNHVDCLCKNENTKESVDRSFKMEKIGQYLVDSDLQIKSDMSANEWTQFLEENPCLKEHKNVLQHYETKSLVQVYYELKNNVQEIFKTSRIAKEISPISIIWNFNLHTDGCIKISSIGTTNSNTSLFAFLQSPRNICLVEVHVNSAYNLLVRCGSIFFTIKNCDTLYYEVVDMKFYSNSILSVLLQQTNTNTGPEGFIMQFHLLTSLMENLQDFDESIEINIPKINGSHIHIPNTLKNIDMPVCKFAVSGSRNVIIVLAENKKKIKLYEMECEDDDDYEYETSNTTCIIEDVNMQENFSIDS